MRSISAAGTNTLTLDNGANTGTVNNVGTLIGGTGADTITLGTAAGNASINLGAGNDTLTFGNFTNTATVANTETIIGGPAATTPSRWARALTTACGRSRRAAPTS